MIDAANETLPPPWVYDLSQCVPQRIVINVHCGDPDDDWPDIIVAPQATFVYHHDHWQAVS